MGTYKKFENLKNFVASTQSTLELSRNFHQQNLLCELTINHDNGAGVTFNSEGFANLINSIEIVANGDKVLKNVDVKKLIYGSIFESGRAMHSVTQTAVAGGLVSKVYFKVPFSLPKRMARPHDTIENSKFYNTFDMRINWGSVANVGTNITVNSAQIKVYSNQLTSYRRNKGEKISHLIETQLTEEVTATTSNMQITLPVQKVYFGLMIVARVDKNRDNTVINKIKLKSGTTVFLEMDAEMLRIDNAHKFGVENEQDIEGIYYLSFTERNKLSDMLDTFGAYNTLQLELDVSKQAGLNEITVYSETVQSENAVEVK